MDLPVAPTDRLLDEVGDEYRLDADGERDYVHPEPGKDPEYDAWLIAEVEQGLREADDPNTVWIPHEEVEAEGARWRSEMIAKHGLPADIE